MHILEDFAGFGISFVTQPTGAEQSQFLRWPRRPGRSPVPGISMRFMQIWHMSVIAKWQQELMDMVYNTHAHTTIRMATHTQTDKTLCMDDTGSVDTHALAAIKHEEQARGLGKMKNLNQMGNCGLLFKRKGSDWNLLLKQKNIYN